MSSTHFSFEQLSAGSVAISSFLAGLVRWCMLIAQMQSGKTETYLFICCEIMRLGLVDNVVIFSGNAEIDLKNQLVNIISEDSFFVKYRNYLANDKELQQNDPRVRTPELREQMVQSFRAKMLIVWGTELKKYTGPENKTLFVWEEAHHAQSQKQQPDKFLRPIGISADGDFEILRTKNNFMLTVSATPFSELSDRHHLVQNKQIIYMPPGRGYNSVQQIIDSGHLKTFTTVEDGLITALRNANKRSSPSYGVVRLTSKNEAMIKRIARRFKWKFVSYNSLSTGREKEEGQQVWDGMNLAPTTKTLIGLRGKCRMGQNLKKQFVSFVMETVQKTNTDTILQGLLGRTCGYSIGSHEIDVYIHEDVFNTGELQKYTEMIESLQMRDADAGEVEIIPTKGANLVKEGHRQLSEFVPIIPLKIARSNQINTREQILADINNALQNTTRVQNKNSQPKFDEISKKIIATYATEEMKKNFEIHYFKKENKLANYAKAMEIKTAFDNGQAKTFGSACGIDAEGLKIKVWVPVNIDNFDMNTIYITATVTPTEEDIIAAQRNKITKTTKKEVFAHHFVHQEENATKVVSNGGLTINLTPKTANDPEEMCQQLMSLIGLSLQIENASKQITSAWDAESKEYKGIIVSQEVLTALSKGGFIYERVKACYGGLTLKCLKTRGKVAKALQEQGLLKLASIAW
jgi:hypothetical protein